MLTFPVTLFSGGGPTITFLQGETIQNASASTYTFSSVNIGTAFADRYVLAVVSCFTNVAGRTLSTMSIGGSFCNLHCNIASSVPATDTIILALGGQLITSGTTTSVNITTSGNMTTCMCQIYTMRGANSPTSPFATATAAANATVSSIATTLNIPVNGAQLVAATEFFSDALTPSGWTEDIEQTVVSFAGTHSGHDNAMSQQSSRSLSSSHGSSARNMSIAAASWA